MNAAVADATTLNSLRAGELFSAFQRSIKASPKVNIWGRAIKVKLGFGYGFNGAKTFLLSDYLFVLHTVYVEAFVGSNGTVDAYTITARTTNMPQGITILGYKYDLGKTTLAQAPLAGIPLVASTCGAHLNAYYEVSGTDEAHLVQTVAVGITGAGSLPRNSQVLSCHAVNSLRIAAGAPGYNRQTGLYRIEESFTTTGYLSDSLTWRKKAAINAVTITAPEYPVIPEMMSLHPQEVAPYAPRIYR